MTESTARVVIPHRIGGKERFGVGLLYLLIRALFATLRLRYDDRSGQIRGGGGPLIFCVWHNRLALTALAYRRYFLKHRPGSRMAAMISASRDGGFLSHIFERFGIQPVRGSSSRRGRQALLEATKLIGDGSNVAITPDGPRGPRYSIQDGIIGLAQLTGSPIIPVSNYVRWKFSLKSWDRFQIPLPFARCEIAVGPPIFVPRDATAEDREKLRLELRRRMDAITRD